MAQLEKTSLDLTVEMLNQLDSVAKSLDVSRQDMIVMFLRHALDQRALAAKALSESAS